MAYQILIVGGFESAVRAKLGVKDSELSDLDINLPIVGELAEAEIIKRVPDWASITDTRERLHLENAIISLISAKLCPSMQRRLNVEVSTIDTRWKKDRVDWEKLAKMLLGEVEESLGEITSVAVDSLETPVLFAIAKMEEATS